MAQLVDDLPHDADTRGVVGCRLSPVMSEPALKLTNGNSEQVCKGFLRGGEDLSSFAKDVAGRSIIAVRLILDDVA